MRTYTKSTIPNYAWEEIYDCMPWYDDYIYDELYQLVADINGRRVGIGYVYQDMELRDNYIRVAACTTPVSIDNPYQSDYDGDECLSYAILGKDGKLKSEFFGEISELENSDNLLIAGDGFTGQIIIDINGKHRSDWFRKIQYDADTKHLLYFNYDDDENLAVTRITDLSLNDVNFDSQYGTHKFTDYGNYRIYETQERVYITYQPNNSLLTNIGGEKIDCFMNDRGELVLIYRMTDNDKYQVMRFEDDLYSTKLPKPCLAMKTVKTFPIAMCGGVEYMPPTLKELFETLDIRYIFWNNYHDVMYLVDKNGMVVKTIRYKDIFMNDYQAMIDKFTSDGNEYAVDMLNKAYRLLNATT